MTWENAEKLLYSMLELCL